MAKATLLALRWTLFIKVLTSYTDSKGSGVLTCAYKSVAGDADSFTMSWEECDHSTDMTLQFSMGDTSSEFDAAFVDHKSVNMSGSISSKSSNVQLAVMSATQYIKAQKGGIHDPDALPAIGAVSSVTRNDQMAPTQQVAGSFVCGMKFVQQMCQQ